MLRYYVHRMCVVVVACLGMAIGQAQDIATPALRLEFRVISQGKPLPMHPGGISRFDFLLPEISLQKESDEWLAGEKWLAFFSVTKGRLSVDTEGSPPPVPGPPIFSHSS